MCRRPRSDFLVPGVVIIRLFIPVIAELLQLYLLSHDAWHYLPPQRFMISNVELHPATLSLMRFLNSRPIASIANIFSSQRRVTSVN